MVMNFGTYDINLHMLNHYKRINSAKNVVNTRARRKNTKNSSKTGSVTSVNSRYSTPTFSGGKRAESAQSNYQQRNSTPNGMQNRASSAPNKIGNKSKPDILPSIKSSSSEAVDELQCPNNTCTSLYLPEAAMPCIKTPVPTPRTLIDTNRIESSSVPEFEYLQFSLRITEDIIKNDLYTNKEMQRVFNSHLEANRGRLSMKKMLEQIDLLCTELNIGKKYLDKSDSWNCAATKTGSINSLKSHDKDLKPNEMCNKNNSKNDIINKILSGEKLMSDDDIQKLNENELQDVITKLLSSHEMNFKEEITTKNENICALNYDDLLPEPELTVEEIFEDISLNEDLSKTKTIKYNLLSPEIKIDDFSQDFSPSRFNYEKYINRTFPKMGIDASVQTLSEPVGEQIETNNIIDCCTYELTETEKSYEVLMDEIVTESTINNQNKDGASLEDQASTFMLKNEDFQSEKTIFEDNSTVVLSDTNENVSKKDKLSENCQSIHVLKSVTSSLENESYENVSLDFSDNLAEIIDVSSAPNLKLKENSDSTNELFTKSKSDENSSTMNIHKFEHFSLEILPTHKQSKNDITAVKFNVENKLQNSKLNGNSIYEYKNSVELSCSPILPENIQPVPINNLNFLAEDSPSNLFSILDVLPNCTALISKNYGSIKNSNENTYFKGLELNNDLSTAKKHDSEMLKISSKTKCLTIENNLTEKKTSCSKRLCKSKFRYPSFFCPDNIKIKKDIPKEPKINCILLESEKINLFDIREFDSCLSKIRTENYNNSDFEKNEPKKSSLKKEFDNMKKLKDGFDILDLDKFETTNDLKNDCRNFAINNKLLLNELQKSFDDICNNFESKNNGTANFYALKEVESGTISAKYVCSLQNISLESIKSPNKSIEKISLNKKNRLTTANDSSQTSESILGEDFKKVENVHESDSVLEENLHKNMCDEFFGTDSKSLFSKQFKNNKSFIR